MSVTWLDDRVAGVRAASLRARLVGTGVLLLVLAVVSGAAWWAWDAGHLDTRVVEVSGTDRVPVEQVQALAEQAVGTPLVAVDVGAIDAAVQELPLVLDVEVERRWPRTLGVVVTERVAVAVVPADEGGYEVVDADGVVLATATEPPPDVPLLRVDVEAAGTDTLAAARDVLAALPADLQRRTTDISAASPADVRLVVDGADVRWGTAADSDRKVEVLLGLLDSVPASVYDVSAPGAPAVRP
ncbi:cell division protein FtsQ/DivIB [Jannaschia sp. R86511]|uniref:cell division protein FtsQ/DivIB n=1 Tax=Jannaschia sp. R86511 TaxID=3093853 RepID=UPI0036D438DA